jgi:predicted MPP superfamily phosphohydrolase
MFLLIVLGFLTLLYGYAGWRMIPALDFPWNLAAGALLCGLALLPLLLIRLRAHLSLAPLTDALSWIAYLSLGFFALATPLFLLRDLAWLVLHLAGPLLVQAGVPGATPLPSAGPPLSDLGVLALATALAARGLHQARRIPPVRRVEVPIQGLPAAFHGFRIAQLSDLHIGPTLKGSFVGRVVERINALNPDLIAFTGDLADGPVERLASQVESLACLRAPCGKFFVTGNHEYYAGVFAWIAQVEKLGFRALLNDACLIERGKATLALAGVTDYGAGEMVPEHASAPQAALSRFPRADLRLLLAHQPRSIFAAAAAGCHLQLSGHTHGGQFVPWKWLVPLQQPFLAGLHRWQGTWLYVHRGTGYWGPPLRLGAPSEIALLVLTAA